ncbi:unnamed protein product [Urochloa decumbens]|uniref:GATA-type domain-containing protein n=1 Tax=Urochloa decumbens TaxID=240449 RepID=A0ABC9G9H9_9POAL
MAADSSCQKVVSSFNQNKSKICTHCHTTITSLWRSGPFGPKSLCNACGLRYRRKGLEVPELESKEDDDKKRRCKDRVRLCRKVIDLYNNDDRIKENTKNKYPGEVDMLIAVYCQNELTPQQIEQHGEEAVTAAITLMNMESILRK